MNTTSKMWSITIRQHKPVVDILVLYISMSIYKETYHTKKIILFVFLIVNIDSYIGPVNIYLT